MATDPGMESLLGPLASNVAAGKKSHHRELPGCGSSNHSLSHIRLYRRVSQQAKYDGLYSGA